MERAGSVILETADRFCRMSGRQYGFFEEYRTENADYVLLLMGSAAGTAKAAVDRLREQGVRAGVIKLRVFRPFPAAELAEAVRRTGCKALAILDRCESYNGIGGPLGSEVTQALYRAKVYTETVNYIYGLAGRDFTVDHVFGIVDELQAVAEGRCKAPDHKYIGLRS